MFRQFSTQFVRMGNFFFRFRDFVFPAVFVALAVFGRPRLGGGSLSSDFALDLAGIAVGLAGLAVRAIVIGYVYIERGGKNKRVYASALVQDGVFAHCRNPLYVGNMLVYAGLMLIYNSPLLYGVGLPFFLVAYLSIVATEENFLRNKFGEAYDDYCARVPRFWPTFKGISKTFAGMKYDVKRVVRKDYGTIFAWVASAIIILIWERRVNLEDEAIRSQENALAALLILASLVYILARILKKTGRLNSPQAPIISRPASDS